MWLNHYNKHTDSSDVCMGVFSVTLWTSRIKCSGHIEVMEYKTDTPVTQHPKHTKDPEEKCLHWGRLSATQACVTWLLKAANTWFTHWNISHETLVNETPLKEREELLNSFDDISLFIVCVMSQMSWEKTNSSLMLFEQSLLCPVHRRVFRDGRWRCRLVFRGVGYRWRDGYVSEVPGGGATAGWGGVWAGEGGASYEHQHTTAERREETSHRHHRD